MCMQVHVHVHIEAGCYMLYCIIMCMYSSVCIENYLPVTSQSGIQHMHRCTHDCITLGVSVLLVVMDCCLTSGHGLLSCFDILKKLVEVNVIFVLHRPVWSTTDQYTGEQVSDNGHTACTSECSSSTLCIYTI